MIVHYDFETTGTNTRKDRPVQIGMVLGVERPRIVMNSLVDPGMTIDPGASDVHGIFADHVANQPDYLIGLYTLRTLMERFATNGDFVVCGYNHERYDNPMAEACYGEPWISKYLQLDLLLAARRYYPRLPSHKLSDVHQSLLKKPLVGAHGAVQDCLGCAALLAHMVQDLGKSAVQLAKELAEPQVWDIMPIGKHKGKKVRDVDPGWAGWMRVNAKDMDRDLKATVDYIMGGCQG